ncbi:MAG: hypothetical protein HeimC3_53140 [Candidatus Heimdallarchaeota archaeon LC_3]|nr:MAG: hypothetical protein HeimC3_53140 [Candidatus Heimdallarchaeota archaeon LC_3]
MQESIEQLFLIPLFFVAIYLLVSLVKILEKIKIYRQGQEEKNIEENITKLYPTFERSVKAHSFARLERFLNTLITSSTTPTLIPKTMYGYDTETMYGSAREELLRKLYVMDADKFVGSSTLSLSDENHVFKTLFVTVKIGRIVNEFGHFDKLFIDEWFPTPKEVVCWKGHARGHGGAIIGLKDYIEKITGVKVPSLHFKAFDLGFHKIAHPMYEDIGIILDGLKQDLLDREHIFIQIERDKLEQKMFNKKIMEIELPPLNSKTLKSIESTSDSLIEKYSDWRMRI